MGRIHDKSVELYDAVNSSLSRLEEDGKKARDLRVVLEADDVIIKGFWVSFFDECVAGIHYSIFRKENRNVFGRKFPLFRERIDYGEIPLHIVPWKYEEANHDAAIICDIVARKIAIRSNIHGTNNVFTSGKDDLILYNSYHAVPLLDKPIKNQPEVAVSFMRGCPLDLLYNL